MLWTDLLKNNKSGVNKKQCGFIPGMGTEQNCLRMMENVRIRLNENNNKQKWSLFIDLKSAFDTVDHDIMLEKLRQKKVKPEIVNTVEWLYG